MEVFMLTVFYVCLGLLCLLLGASGAISYLVFDSNSVVEED
jgi:hypothetical protein